MSPTISPDHGPSAPRVHCCPLVAAPGDGWLVRVAGLLLLHLPFLFWLEFALGIPTALLGVEAELFVFPAVGCLCLLRVRVVWWQRAILVLLYLCAQAVIWAAIVALGFLLFGTRALL